MESRSKVWPHLVRGSLDFSLQHSVRSVSIPELDYRSRISRALASLRTQLSQSSHQCGDGLADIFCVSGGITAMTGSLIACFGIFPRNQARIRLFLECVGCSMVIVGVLIVLLSLKARRGSGQIHGLAGDEFSVSHLLRSSSSYPQLSAVNWQARPPRISRGIQSKSSNFSDRSEAEDFPQVAAAPDFGGPQRQHQQQPSQILEESERSRDSTQSSSDVITDVSFATEDKLTATPADITNDKNHDDDDANNNNNNVELELSELDVPSSLNPSSWTPDEEDCYGLDHQAAIEAALSTVLTVSTLVGFRSDGIQVGGHQGGDCCVRHAVQRKMSAQKWIKRLRISRLVASSSQRRKAETASQQRLSVTSLAQINPQAAGAAPMAMSEVTFEDEIVSVRSQRATNEIGETKTTSDVTISG